MREPKNLKDEKTLVHGQMYLARKIIYYIMTHGWMDGLSLILMFLYWSPTTSLYTYIFRKAAKDLSDFY